MSDQDDKADEDSGRQEDENGRGLQQTELLTVSRALVVMQLVARAREPKALGSLELARVRVFNELSVDHVLVFGAFVERDAVAGH